jgi:hypothetical protein
MRRNIMRTFKNILSTVAFIIFAFNCLAAATTEDMKATDRRTTAIALLREIAATPDFPVDDPRADILYRFNVARDVDMLPIILPISQNPDHNAWESTIYETSA